MPAPVLHSTRFLMRSLLWVLLCFSTSLVQAQDDDDFFFFDEEEEESVDIADPFETFNRVMFGFNDRLYRSVLKPVARGLRILPAPVRVSTGNFLNNLGAPVSAFSALLQGDLPNAGSELGRFAVNSTLGILGLFDPATPMGLAQDEEDIGQTLAVYGIGYGPYLVLPFLGSSSLRDSVGTIATNGLTRELYGLKVGEMVAIRVTEVEILLSLDQDTYEAFYDSALDPYIFFRSAWVQNRAGRVAR